MSSTEDYKEGQWVTLSDPKDYILWHCALNTFAKELGVQGFLEGKAFLEPEPPAPDASDRKYEKTAQGLLKYHSESTGSSEANELQEGAGSCHITDLTDQGWRDFERDAVQHSLWTAKYITLKTGIWRLAWWIRRTVSSDIRKRCCVRTGSISDWYKNIVAWYEMLEEDKNNDM